MVELINILAVPLSVVDERTKSRGAVAGPGAMRTAQISTCPIPSLVVYNENSYPTKMSAISWKTAYSLRLYTLHFTTLTTLRFTGIINEDLSPVLYNVDILYATDIGQVGKEVLWDWMFTLIVLVDNHSMATFGVPNSKCQVSSLSHIVCSFS